MSLTRVHVVVEGRVQGVFFRACTREQARKFCLCGWVRNRPDGSVEAELEGNEKDVERMLSWFHQGSPHSEVLKVTKTSCSPLGTENDFVVRY